MKTKAIVLRALKYGESRLIVDLFTREAGRLSVILSLPRTSRGKLRKQLFQPLSLLDADIDIRPNVQLHKIRDAQLLTPLNSIPFEPPKVAIALFVCEFLHYALRAEQQGGKLFDYIVNSIVWLDEREAHYANFHLVFLMHMSRFLGFYPNLEHYQEGCLFDLRAGTFSMLMPLHHDVLPPHEAALAIVMMRMDFATMHLYHLTRSERARLLDVLLTYYRLHLPSFPELKSVEVLKELFS